MWIYARMINWQCKPEHLENETASEKKYLLLLRIKVYFQIFQLLSEIIQMVF